MYDSFEYMSSDFDFDQDDFSNADFFLGFGKKEEGIKEKIFKGLTTGLATGVALVGVPAALSLGLRLGRNLGDAVIPPRQVP